MRFRAREAEALKPLGGRPPFGWLRGADPEGAVGLRDRDRHQQLLGPWRLIGERVAVTHRPAAWCGSAWGPSGGGAPAAKGPPPADRRSGPSCRRGGLPREGAGAVAGAAGEGGAETRAATAARRLRGGDRRSLMMQAKNEPDRLMPCWRGCSSGGIRDQLDNLFDEAARAELSGRETLMLLCEREIARKDIRRIEMAIRLAHFPAVKELAGFDFSGAAVARSAPRSAIWPASVGSPTARMCCCSGRRAWARRILSIALGREAILAGYTVQFIAATALVARLAKAHGEGRLEKLLAVLLQAEAADRRRAGLSAARAGRGASVLPAGQPPLRKGSHADHLEPRIRANGGRCSATRWSPPRSSTGCCTTATC